MESKVLASIRRNGLLAGGERVICAVSGGADSMALLWCLWLLKEKLGITVEAAHFNHHLRGAESDRDEQFVREFCDFHDIPLHVGGGSVVPGAKGLEAAAREARYGFLRSLGGTVATAHTADDNAETVIMHLIRGTGLRGLGGIAPSSPGLIRPMLDVTRQEVETFLAENWIPHIEDSSNGSDAFLRNRIRHGVMPLLKGENPSLPENLSAMAQRLRQDSQTLEDLSESIEESSVAALRSAEPPLRRRALERLLKQAGLAEPNASHIAQAEALVWSEKPSAFARFPGGVLLRRSYDRIQPGQEPVALETVPLRVGQTVALPQIGMALRCDMADGERDGADSFSVCPRGQMVVRSRCPGDEITRSGGTKTLKKIFVDRKIPQYLRMAVPVIADEAGVLGVYGIGKNLSRTEAAAVRITFVKISQMAEENTENK